MNSCHCFVDGRDKSVAVLVVCNITLCETKGCRRGSQNSRQGKESLMFFMYFICESTLSIKATNTSRRSLIVHALILSGSTLYRTNILGTPTFGFTLRTGRPFHTIASFLHVWL